MVKSVAQKLTEEYIESQIGDMDFDMFFVRQEYRKELHLHFLAGFSAAIEQAQKMGEKVDGYGSPVVFLYKLKELIEAE